MRAQGAAAMDLAQRCHLQKSACCGLTGRQAQKGHEIALQQVQRIRIGPRQTHIENGARLDRTQIHQATDRSRAAQYADRGHIAHLVKINLPARVIRRV